MKFGHRFRWLFALCLAMNAAGLSLLFATGLPMTVVNRGVIVGAGMAVYFALFVSPIFHGKLPGKEFGVGLFFSLGCYCVLGVELRTTPMFVGLAGLVTYNCLVISARDREVDSHADPGAASQWWQGMDRDLTVVGGALFALAAGCALIGIDTWFYVVLAAAFFFLVLLHHQAANHSSDAVRALADFCILTPLPLLAYSL